MQAGRSSARLVADQRYDVARAGVFDGFLQARERADVNHGIKQSLPSVIHTVSFI